MAESSKYNIPEAKPAITKFESGNAQSDGVNSLKRIEFEFMGKSYKFVFNPEEYTQSEPARVTITQTKGGAWADDFGAGLPIITMKGTTGFRIGHLGNTMTSGRGTNGFERFKELRDLIREYYGKLAPGQEVTSEYELIFHNYTDGEDWIVTPETFNLMRSVARPLLYLYDIKLLCLRPANQPVSRGTDTGGIGKISSPDVVDYGS